MPSVSRGYTVIKNKHRHLWESGLRHNARTGLGAQGFKAGQTVTHQGVPYHVYDFDADRSAPGGATVSLLAHDRTHALRGVSIPSLTAGKTTMEKSQIIGGVSGHPKNNRRWPGPSPEEYSEGWDDNIKKDGTDYMGKSFAQHVMEYPVILDGVEMSEFLDSVVKSIGDVFTTFEGRLNQQIDAVFEQSAEFDKSLGESVLHIGRGVHEVGERIEFLEEQISKSVHSGNRNNVGYLRKGIGGDEGLAEHVTRDEVMGALLKGVETGRIDALEVIKFETNGEISPNVRKSLGL